MPYYQQPSNHFRAHPSSKVYSTLMHSERSSGKFSNVAQMAAVRSTVCSMVPCATSRRLGSTAMRSTGTNSTPVKHRPHQIPTESWKAVMRFTTQAGVRLHFVPIFRDREPIVNMRTRRAPKLLCPQVFVHSCGVRTPNSIHTSPTVIPNH